MEIQQDTNPDENEGWGFREAEAAKQRAERNRINAQLSEAAYTARDVAAELNGEPSA